MKHFKLFSSLFLFVFFTVAVGCKSSYIQTPKFAAVTSIYDLKLNSSLSDVITILGSKPYNVYSSQIDGYTIYTYKYKLVERRILFNQNNKVGHETDGKEVYNGKAHDLYLIFKDNKLESFVTSEGRDDSPALVMMNNTLYTITKDKQKYILVPNVTAPN